MKLNPTRYSSQVGEVWVHFMFKIKYEIRCKDNELGFDDNHVHMVLDLGIKSKPELAKKVKGFVGRKFFMVFPELKKSKAEGGLFWDSGLWSPASYGGTP